MKICIIIYESHKNLSYKNVIDYYKRNINFNSFYSIYYIYNSDIIDNEISDNNIKINNNINDIYNICNIDNYDYILFLNNEKMINLNDTLINNFINILEKNENCNQILLQNIDEKCKTDILNIDNYDFFKLNIEKHFFEYEYYYFEMIKYIINDKKNPFNKPDINIYIDYLKYTDNKYYNFNYFTIDNSIIKLNFFKNINKFPIKHFTFYEKDIARYLIINNNYSLIYNIELIRNTQIMNIVKQQNYNNITIVTGFFNINKTGGKKHSYDYLIASKKTLSIPQPMVIYASLDMIEKIKEFRKDYMDITKIIEITEENLYMYIYKDIINENCKKNISPYNNYKYIMCVNARYNYLRDTIKNNYFNTEYICWIDFALNHIVEMNDFKIFYNNPDKIRIAWIGRLNKNIFTYNHKCLGGGIYCGSMNSMLKLIELHDAEFIKLMNLGYNINDDKLLFIIFEKYPELFDIYFSSYGMMCNKINIY